MENNITTENGKTAAIISYITIIGWLISFFAMYKANKTVLSTYHLRQSLLLHLTSIAINVLLSIIVMIFPIAILSFVSIAIFIIYVIFIILGAISANNGEQKPLPIIGGMAQSMFASI